MERTLTKEQKTALGNMLVDAFRAGDLAVVEGCLRQGADLSHSIEWYGSSGNYQGNRPVLHWAAYFSKKREILAAVIGAATDLDVRTGGGDNVLFAAVEAKNAVAAAMFTAAGADILAQNKGGQVALEKARHIGDAGARQAVVEAMLADYSGQPKPLPAKKEESRPAPAPLPQPPAERKNRGNSFHL